MGAFIFEDYIIDLLKQDESTNLYAFAENCGLIIPNVTKRSRVTDNNFSLIDDFLFSKNQITCFSSYELPFNTDLFMLLYETSISFMQAKNDIIEIETRDFSTDNRRKFKLELALFDSSEMYKKILGIGNV